MNLKRFVMVALVLCLALCLCACGGETAADDTKAATQSGNSTDAATQPSAQQTEPTAADTKVDYTVTVVDYEGNPVAGARVQMCVGELCKPPVTTDEQGIATINCDPDVYEVKVTNVPENLQEPTVSSHFGEGEYEMTIELKQKVYEYSVTVIDEAGNPVPLVTVQFDNANLSEAKTDEEGKTGTNGFEVIPGFVLTEIPAGYAADITEYTFEEGVYEMTVVLKAVA